MELEKSLEIAKTFLGGFASNIAFSIEQDNAVEGLIVKRNGNNVSIKYNHLNELFRALTLVKEKQAEVNYEVSLKPRFALNGLMIDCSRNGVVTVDNLKKIILIMALMGHNQLLLYTEDTYELKKYPYFGYLRGAYTEKELKDIVSYGASFGVELIPCIQTLDHLAAPLRWMEFYDMRDGESNLMANEPKTYELIEEMIKTSRECFSSKLIHIGMDESFGLGTGRFLSKHGYHDRLELFCKHLAKVIDICKKYDFTPMIWSDMFFRLNDENSEYYSGKPLDKKTLDLIPEGVDLVYWDYYHDDKKIYDDMIASHLKSKGETYFAGGSWRWLGFAPALHKSSEFTKAALTSCLENGLKNVFVTAWGDNGNEASMYSIILTLAEYSTFSYLGTGDDKSVDSLLNAVTGETKERLLLLDLPNMPDKRVLAAAYNPSKYFFYQDPLLGLFDKQVKPNFAANYKEYALILDKASKESKNYSLMYQVLSKLCSFLELKVDLGVKLRTAYKANDKKTLKRLVKKVIPDSIKRLEAFRKLFVAQWLNENKSFGLEIVDGRIGFQKQRLESTIEVVGRYLKGQANVIEELEAEILPYNGFDYEVNWNQWTTTVSSNVI